MPTQEDTTRKVYHFGVDIDDTDRRLVRVYSADENIALRFDTEEDAKRADLLTTRMMEIVCELWQGGAELLDKRTWPSGERPADEPTAPEKGGEG